VGFAVGLLREEKGANGTYANREDWFDSTRVGVVRVEELRSVSIGNGIRVVEHWCVRKLLEAPVRALKQT